MNKLIVRKAAVLGAGARCDRGDHRVTGGNPQGLLTQCCLGERGSQVARVAALQRMLLAGMSEEQVRAVEAGNQVQPRFTLRALT